MLGGVVQGVRDDSVCERRFSVHRNSPVCRGNQINFLDVTIHRTPTYWRIAVYRKPTFTDTIIPYTSNHPTQHKYAAVRYLYNRLHTYNLQPDDYDTEATAIQNILYNNAFPIHHGNPPNPKLSPDITGTQTKITHTHIPRHKNGPRSPTWAKKPRTSQTCSKRLT